MRGRNSSVQRVPEELVYSLYRKQYPLLQHESRPRDRDTFYKQHQLQQVLTLV